jgi:hypothetical protein
MDHSIAMMLWTMADSSGDRMALVERGNSTDHQARRARAPSVGLYCRGSAFVPRCNASVAGGAAPNALATKPSAG